MPPPFFSHQIPALTIIAPQEKYGLGGYGADHTRGINWGKWAITSDDPAFNVRNPPPPPPP